MRVLHLYAGNLYGGIERMLVTLARHRDVAPDLQQEFGLCFRGRLSEELAANGAEVHDLGEARFSRPWTVMRARRALRCLLVNREIDAVISHGAWPHALFASTASRVGVSKILMIHGQVNRRHWLDRLASRTR